jgi:putative redox protein
VATCMLTIMGIYARRHALDIAGARYRVEKHMSPEPRRIGRLVIEIDLPAMDDERHRRGLETSAMACPVKKSLHPDIELDISLRFGDPS